jgi:hypothetical protein
MCEHQVRDDIARQRAIAVGVEEAVHRCELATGPRIECGGLVAQVLGCACTAGDEPASERRSSESV